MADERILNRVRALLAQAADKGATEEERQAFAAKAAELMARHELSEDMLRVERGEAPDPVGRWDFTIRGRGGHGKARVNALYSIVRAYGCEAAVRGNDSGTQDRLLMIVGTEGALASLKILLPAISMQMETSAIKAARDHSDGLDPYFYTEAERTRERRVFFRSYLQGWGGAVAEKISKTRDDIAQESAGTSAALVLVTNRDRVVAEYKRRFPKLGKARKDRTFSAAGYVAGTNDGRSADIGTGNLSTTARKSLG